MSQACNQVFSSGVRTIIFGDFLGCDRQLSQVNKAFCDANRSALIKVGDQIARRGPLSRDQMLELERPEHPEARLPELIAGISGKIEGDLGNEGHNKTCALWNGVLEMRKQLEHERNPEVNHQRVFNLVTHLEAFDRDFEHWVRDDALLKHLEELNVRDRIANRFAIVISERRLDPHDPQQVLECFHALYESQHASCRSAKSSESLPKPTTNSLQEFHRLEKSVFDLEWQAQEQGLQDLWQELRPLVLGPVLRSTYLIRNWMNDPANAGALANVQNLEVDQPERFSQIPREIEKLTGLRALRWGGHYADNGYDQVLIPCDYSTLPNELANLQQLESLALEGNNFTEIPAVLGRLPALRRLHLSGHQRPIRVIPDAVERQLNSRFVDLLLTLVGNEGERVMGIFSGNPFAISTIGLPSQHLTDMPFRVWFRTNFFVPNIPLIIFSLIMAPTFLLPEGPITACCVMLPSFLIGLPFLLLGLPFALVNIAIQLGLEPLVTLVRDKLGYSRMVHVRDFPEVAALPEQPAAV